LLSFFLKGINKKSKSSIKKSQFELLNNISQNTDFYFVHSFYFRTQKNENCIATTKYPNPITAAVLKENIFGTQFHPEKSHNNGKQIIINFLEWEPS